MVLCALRGGTFFFFKKIVKQKEVVVSKRSLTDAHSCSLFYAWFSLAEDR